MPTITTEAIIVKMPIMMVVIVCLRTPFHSLDKMPHMFATSMMNDICIRYVTIQEKGSRRCCRTDFTTFRFTRLVYIYENVSNYYTFSKMDLSSIADLTRFASSVFHESSSIYTIYWWIGACCITAVDSVQCRAAFYEACFFGLSKHGCVSR